MPLPRPSRQSRCRVGSSLPLRRALRGRFAVQPSKGPASGGCVRSFRRTAVKTSACRNGLAWRGAKLARRAARHIRDGVDSAMETRLRMLLVLAGLPAAEVNFILRHPDGSWWMRFDLCYPSLKLIIEYDGRQHAEDSDQWLHDLRRREALHRTGWRVIVDSEAGLLPGTGRGVNPRA
jgi:very-short-patch-repair endonuclease